MPRASRSDELKREVGKRLQEIVDALDMPKHVLAEGIGVSPTAFSNYLKGTNLFDVMAAIRLRKSFAISLDFIYCDSLAALDVEIRDKILAMRAPSPRPFDEHVIQLRPRKRRSRIS